MPYVPVEPLMAGPWGPPPIVYPPWAGGIDHVLHHLCTSTQDGQDQLKVLAMEATIHGTSVLGVLATGRIGESQGRKTRQSGMSNWTIQFPQRQQQLLVSGASSGCPRTGLLLMNQGAARVR
jgi:hypothetical protein